ncbi:helix-turn-helix transcriptional regulator [Arthrobacter sp. CAL618]|uniref:helix-turn-helix transcriptional regulator n=1 Tax=Arthrobacter sp. CAL618 TaxID=1055770 RepID=UPI00040EFE59|nr:LuxR family transcriptional regulator [Arthrobacter sp. CAL618]
MSIQAEPGGLIGREREVEEISASIMNPTIGGVLVCGPSGIGKTAVVDSVLDRLKSKTLSVTVYADSTLRCVPYGALAPVIGGQYLSDVGSPLSVLRLIKSGLRTTAASDLRLPVLVVLRNAHHLDEDSGHLLGQLAVAGEIRLLAVSDEPGDKPIELHELWRDGLVKRVDLAALSRDQTARLCQQQLGGTVSAGTVALIFDWSQGRPYLARALISHFISAGALVETNGVWLISSTPESLGDVLLDRVKNILNECSPAERQVVEAVASVGCMPVALAGKILDAVAMDGAFQLNLLAYSNHHGGAKSCITVAPKLYGEVITSLMPPGRRVQIIRWLQESVVGQSELEAVCASTLVTFKLELGYSVDDHDLLEAARQANNGYAPGLAERFSAAVTSRQFAIAARVENARSLLGLADIEAAASEVSGLIESATDVYALCAAAVTEAQIYLRGGGGPDGLLAIAGRWTKAGHRLPPEQFFHLERGSAVLKNLAFSLAGDYAAAISGLRQIVEEHSPETLASGFARVLLGELSAITGRASDVSGTVWRAVSETRPGGLMADHYRAIITRQGVLSVQIRDDAAVAQLLQWHEQNAPKQVQYFGGEMTAIEGMMEVRRGRVRAGCELLADGIEVLRYSDPELVLPLALGTAAFAWGLVGRLDKSTSYAHDLDALPYQGDLPRRLVSNAYVTVARSWPAVNAPDLSVVVARADQARSLGLVHAEAEILEILFLLQHPVPQQRFRTVSERIDGIGSEAAYIMAEVAESNDPARFTAASDRALDSGLLLLGAECLARAAVCYNRLGKWRAQHAVLQRLRGLGHTLGDVRTAAISDNAMARVALTRREKEIAALAAEGAATSEIAHSLTVSPRTVEGHLYRVYLKLGISGRDELMRGFVSAGVTPK